VSEEVEEKIEHHQINPASSIDVLLKLVIYSNSVNWD